MKKFLILFVFLLFAVNVSATKVNITVVDDRVYTGAILKLVNLETGKLSDPYYPTFVGKNIGVIKFNVETGWSDVNLSLRFLNNGEISSVSDGGPFAINGSDITLDLREVEIVVEEENVSANKSVENKSVEIVFEGTDEKNFEIDSQEEINKTGLIGYVFKNYDGMWNSISIGLSILLAGIFIFFIVRMAYRSGAKAELRDLGKMEMDRRIDELKD